MENWQIKAAGWELLAFSLRYPSVELAKSITSGEWADAADELAAALDVELPHDFSLDARANVDEDPAELLHALRTEATYLFVGAPKPACNPYEGAWRTADDGVETLLFVNPYSMAVERFCKRCGLDRPEGTNEPLDFIATEFELLQYLAMREAGMFEQREDIPLAEDLPGGCAACAHEEFVTEHALAWIPRFAKKLADETRIPFYRAVAKLIDALVA